MSVTLRDAQHLSWKTFKRIQPVNSSGSAGFDSAAEFAKKAEQVAGRIRMLQEAGSSGQREVAKLFSELLFSLFVLSERYGVSLEDSFLQAVDELILDSVS